MVCSLLLIFSSSLTRPLFRLQTAFKELDNPPEIYVAITSEDASIVYYKLSLGIVKPLVWLGNGFFRIGQNSYDLLLQSTSIVPPQYANLQDERWCVNNAFRWNHNAYLILGSASRVHDCWPIPVNGPEPSSGRIYQVRGSGCNLMIFPSWTSCLTYRILTSKGLASKTNLRLQTINALRKPHHELTDMTHCWCTLRQYCRLKCTFLPCFFRSGLLLCRKFLACECHTGRNIPNIGSPIWIRRTSPLLLSHINTCLGRSNVIWRALIVQ